MAINALEALGPGSFGEATRPAGGARLPDGGFARILDQVLGSMNAQQVAADQAVRELATGQTEDIHNVMLAVARADLSFRMILEVRNRLVDAFQEVMRMQV